MSLRHRRLTARHWRRRLYRWRRAAGLSVIACVAWLVRVRNTEPAPRLPAPLPAPPLPWGRPAPLASVERSHRAFEH
jgi:hypothetical protein